MINSNLYVKTTSYIRHRKKGRLTRPLQYYFNFALKFLLVALIEK